MGAGYHGEFGATHGSNHAVAADSTLIGNGRGFELKEASKRVKKINVFTDVACKQDGCSSKSTFTKHTKPSHYFIVAMTSHIYRCLTQAELYHISSAFAIANYHLIA